MDRRLLRSIASLAGALGLAPLANAGLGLVRRIRNPGRIRENRRLRQAGAPDGLPIPSDHLLYLISTGASARRYLETGERSYQSIRRLLAEIGRPAEAMSAVLDFGCGCGRVLRYWRDSAPAAFGCDYNARLVRWCQRHLPHVDARVTDLTPPLPYADDTFDFVYALSVFTHLPEAEQHSWMGELRRVLRPGGVLLVTLHGPGSLNLLTADERREFESGRMIVTNAEYRGTNICAAFHPVEYVHEVLAKGCQVLAYHPAGGAAVGVGHQDLYLLAAPDQAI